MSLKCCSLITVINITFLAPRVSMAQSLLLNFQNLATEIVSSPLSKSHLMPNYQATGNLTWAIPEVQLSHFFTNNYYFLNSVVSRGGKSSLQFSHQFESLWIQQKNFGISTNFTKLCCGMAWNLALEDHVSYLVIAALFIHVNQSQLMQTCKLLYNIEFTYSLTCILIFWFF